MAFGAVDFLEVAGCVSNNVASEVACSFSLNGCGCRNYNNLETFDY